MRLATSKQRTLIIGQTGSGKTVAAVWHLSKANFLSQPWYILNHKREELVNSIPGAEFVGLEETPKKPGIYIYSPAPDVDDESVDDLLRRIHARGRIGLYIDEGYMINPRSGPLNTIYTQGRSLHLPTITLSQRPARISRFAVSESDYYQIFYLVDDRDKDLLSSFVKVPKETNLSDIIDELPRFHSLYFDVAARKAEILKPVPHEDLILQTFEDSFKLSRKRSRLL